MREQVQKRLNRITGSLQFKFFIGIDFAIIISCIMLGGFMLSSQFSTELAQTLSLAGSNASRATELIEAQTQAIRSHADIVTMDDEVERIFNADNTTSYPNITEWIRDYEKVTGQIERGCYNSAIQSMYVITDNIFASSYPSEIIFPLERLKGTQWYERAKDKSSLLFHLPDAFGGKLPESEQTIYFTRNLPILYRNYETYFVGSIDKGILSDILTSDAHLQYSACGLLNSEGDFIFLDDEKYFDTLSEINETLYSSSDFVLSETSVNGDRFYAIKRQIYNTDLNFLYLVDYQAMRTAILNAYVSKLLFLLLFLLPLSVLISYAISHPLSRRMAALRDSMLKAENGGFELLPLSEKDEDEISMLNRRFNSMLTQISHLMEQQYIDGKRIKELEYISLQAQINPHFLYNTLDLIKWNAIANHDRDTEELITALSDYYRLALSRGRETVPLRSELDHIKAYVFIQNKRFDDGITLEIDVNEKYLDYQLPKLLLQPIVENAIMHGILELPDPVGTIWVQVREDGNALWLSIRDNGVGLTESENEPVMRDTPDDTAVVIKTGYGLKNIDDRIKLAFGNEYGLELRNNENGRGAEALLRLPCLESKR